MASVSIEKEIDYLQRTDPGFSQRRRKTVGIYIVRAFLSGIEYSAVDACLYLYLKRFNAGPLFYGLVLSCYEITCVAAFPVSGVFFDRTKRGREAMLFFNSIFVIGNLVFMLSISKWVVLLGRALSGIGEGFRPVIEAEVAWMYKQKDRLPIYTYIATAFFTGISIGPGVNGIFIDVHFYLGTILIDYGNVSGFVMAIVWVVVLILTHFLVSSMALEILTSFENRKGSETEELKGPLSDAETEEENEIGETRPMESALPESAKPGNSRMEIDPDLPEVTDKNNGSINDKNTGVEQNIFQHVLGILVKHLFSVLAFSIILGFICMFIGRTGQTLSYLVLYRDFHWSEKAVVIFTVVIAGVVLSSFISVRIFGDMIGELGVLLLSLVLMLAGAGLMLTYNQDLLYFVSKELTFCIGITLFVVSIAIHNPATKCLTSKIAHLDVQGRIQGLALVTRRAGFILGPLASSHVLDFVQLGGTIAFVTIVVCTAMLVALIPAYKARIKYMYFLKIKSEKKDQSTKQEEEDTS